MKIWVVFKRELGAYFGSPIAYIFLVAFLVLTGLFFSIDLFYYQEGSMRALFELFPLTFLFIVPAVSMRIWAEDKKTGTFEMIMTLPIRDYEVVWGKFLAAWAFMVIAIMLTFPWTFMVEHLTAVPPGSIVVGGEGGLSSKMDWSPIIMGYLASILLAGAYLSIGSFMSSLTKNQIIAFILTGFVLNIFATMSHPMFISTLEKVSLTLTTVAYNLSFSTHFESISRGILDVKDLVYFTTIIIIFLEFNRLSVKYRH